MRTSDLVVVEEDNRAQTIKIILIVAGIVLAVAGIAVAVALIVKKCKAKKILAEVDLDGDGESDATMIDTNGDGEVDTIVFHED